jgi:predicted SPOUT superfamily RNA methylase MTH1
MNGEELPILPIALLALGGLYFGYEVERRRKRLRSIFDTFDKEESRIATMLEQMVEAGQITPYVPNPVTS